MGLGANGHPSIIQGGMGVAVSGWRLAAAVARTGQLGVVSGTGLDAVLARRLQQGDEGGHLRRAMAGFPVPGVAERALERYFFAGGKSPGVPFATLPKARVPMSRETSLFVALANFVEVSLAREGHGGRIGINYLEKIQLYTLPALFGALLAGVDFVLMGAGIPREIPGAIDALCAGRIASLSLLVAGAGGDPIRLELDPASLCGGSCPPLRRPAFLAIVSSVSLALVLARKATGKVDGFVVEGPSAGGHNAPPRGALQLDARGEPIYGERDQVDLEKMRELGLPFWVAGSCAAPQTLAAVRGHGAAGIQVGTAFALCRESGLDGGIRRQLLERAMAGGPEVATDVLASPTGFPFKVARLAGSLAETDLYRRRERLCDLGYLRTAHRREDGRVDLRCAAEPIPSFLAKGGSESETDGRICLCNALLANIGLGQLRKGGAEEAPLVTLGNDLRLVRECVAAHGVDYSATEVIARLLAPARS